MSLRLAADALLCAAAVPVLLAAAYLFALTTLSRRGRAPARRPPHLRFDVVIPAHDEEAGIAATIASVASVDYPSALRRVVVVADNCADRTAAVAEAAGARVLVRHDPARRGKGYALALAFERCLADGFADAVAVVDADTLVSPDLLRAFAARLDAGGAAVQGRYAVRNPDASWRTRLMAIAFALFHDVRSLARERLSLSSGLRGNGMCFAAPLLRAIPHDAFSIVEDVEYGIRLGRAGHRVHYAHDAVVWGDMTATAAAARSQRLRWEGGRRRLARALGLPLLAEALRARDRVLGDLALDLLVPPLSHLGAAAAIGLAAAGTLRAAAGAPMASPWLWGAGAGMIALHVARGWWLSGTGLRGAVTLLRAPLYLAWKLGIRRSGSDAASGWIRTTREAAERPPRA